MNLNDEIRMTNDERNSGGGLHLPGVSWTAVAERSGDTAFGRMEESRGKNIFRAGESGVALRFPPQSKTRQIGDSLEKNIFHKTAHNFLPA